MVPEKWTQKTLLDITKWSSGGTPSKNNPLFWGGDIPWISAISMRGHFFSDSALKVTELAASKTAKIAEKNNILLLVRGSMLWNKIPVGINTKKVSFNQDVKCITPNPKHIDNIYLLYWFISKENYLMGMVTGTGIGAGKLDTSDLQSMDILLPPLPEQKKIAQILSTWDKAITATEQLLTTSQQQKKALMQQLLTGKKRLLDDNGVRFSGEWKSYHLSELTKVVMGSSPKSAAYNEVELGLPLLQGNADIKNRRSAPRIYTSEITRECEVNDILLSVRAPVGTVAISSHHACIGRGIAAIRAKENSSQEFIYQWLLWFEPKWISLSQGSTFESINSDDIKQLKVKSPEYKEQQKIATVLTSADQEINSLQQKIEALKQEKKALMQQLLTGKRRVKLN